MTLLQLSALWWYGESFLGDIKLKHVSHVTTPTQEQLDRWQVPRDVNNIFESELEIKTRNLQQMISRQQT